MVRRLIHVFLVPARVCLSVWIIVNVDMYVRWSVVWMTVLFVLAEQIAHSQYEQDDTDGEPLESQHQQPADHGRHDAHLVHDGQ